ncbi:hypothetical protein MBLNU457_g2932t1 [Dothideomycetes sp. NU457]
MPPKKSKGAAKRKGPAKKTRSQSPEGLTPDPATWKGWCEIESDPVYFSVMMSEMGVSGLKIQEVLGLDDGLLAILPKPVHAMIFLFQYQTGTKETYESNCPDDLWFANQVPDNACATVAILNIINNIPDLRLGAELRDFKDATQSLSPYERGEAIDDFHHVKIVHNSFAREMDMLDGDLEWKRKQEKAIQDAKKRKASSTPSKQPAKKAKVSPVVTKSLPNSSTEAKASEDTLRRSGRTRTQTTKYQEIDSDNDTEETAAGTISEEGYHFIAYMPIKDEVWRLDGMDPFPQNLGKPEDGQDWLSVVKPALQARMAQYEEGQIEFSLMAVVQDPIINARNALAVNIKSIREVEIALDSKSSEWRHFIQSTVINGHDKETNSTSELKHQPEDAPKTNTHDHEGKVKADEGQQSKALASQSSMEQNGPEKDLVKAMSIEYGISEADISNAEVPGSIEQQIIEGSAESLLALRTQLVTQQAGCRYTIRDETQMAETDRESARLRRDDFRPFLSAWIASLKENDSLDALAHQVRAKA